MINKKSRWWLGGLGILLIVGAIGPVAPAQAQCKPDAFYYCRRDIKVCRWGSLEVGILNIEAGKSICSFFKEGEPTATQGTAGLAELIQQLIVVIVVMTIMAAAVSIVVGGYIYMTAGGSAERVNVAKGWIVTAIIGITIAVLGWVILGAIAVNLV